MIIFFRIIFGKLILNSRNLVIMKNVCFIYILFIISYNDTLKYDDDRLKALKINYNFARSRMRFRRIFSAINFVCLSQQTRE